MLPTFIIAGAPKCGTTSLFKYLGEHPDTCMSSIKEPDFFTEERGQDKGAGPDASIRSGQFSKGLEWYESLFEHCGPDTARGEASPYIQRPDAPGLIRRAIPEVRLIFILRNPIDRTFSNYWQDIKKGAALPPFDEAVRTDHPRIRRYLEASTYSKGLTSFYNEFDPGQILILLFDDLVRDPGSVVNYALDHIGVARVGPPKGGFVLHNQASAPRSRLLQRGLLRTGQLFAATPLPHFVRKPVRRLGGGLRKRNTVVVGDAQMKEHTRAYLRARFTNEVDYVERCLGRDLSHWR